MAEFDALRQVVERVQSELQSKSSLKDNQSMFEYVKTQIDGIAKELLLRVTIKDMCTLLD